MHRLSQKEPHIITLIIMSSFASMGAVIFTPALPQLSTFFNISTNRAQLAITLFLVGYAIGQLIYGPLSNRYGRKAALFIGIGIATAGSIVSILSEPLNSFVFLILGRLLEALGSSAGLVTSFTIVNDHYYPEDARKIISYMMLAFAVVPGIATLIGGALVSHYHWISCFYFLLVYGLLLIVPVMRLAETIATKDTKALSANKILKNYLLAIKNKRLRLTAIFFGLTSMCIYVYAASAPLIAISYLHFSTSTFGLLGLIPFIGTGLGALTSAKLSQRFSSKILIKAGLMIEFIATILMCILFYLNVVNLFLLITFGFIFMFGGCIIISNAASDASTQLEDKANASAIMNFINIGMAVLGTFILAVTSGSPILKLPTIFLIAMIIMFGLWQFLPKKHV